MKFMKNILVDIYKNRIDSLLNREYVNINYIGKSFDGVKNLKPTEEEIKKFRKLCELNEASAEYNLLYKKLSNWKMLDSCVDYDNNSIAELIDKINAIEYEEIKHVLNHKNEIIEQIKIEYILFFDTETTGLPKNWKAHVSDFNNWPRLVQLAWQLYDEKGYLVEKKSVIVKPRGFQIPKESSTIHGITTDIAISNGTEIEDVLNEFKKKLLVSKVLIAHNMSFDEKIIGCEFLRVFQENLLANKAKICTMELSTNICRIPGEYGFKWPKLQELHKFLFGEEFEEAHDAEIDIEATAKCYWEMKKRNLL